MGIRVLCIDDEPGIRALLRISLQHTAEAQVDVAGSSEEALALLEEIEPPDLCVVDYSMSGMSGADFCRRLRQDERFAAVRVVFLTADAPSNSPEWYREAGANGCLAKPFSPFTIGRELLAFLGLPIAVEAA
jgi:CheY-like chemotaxis protein